MIISFKFERIAGLGCNNCVKKLLDLVDILSKCNSSKFITPLFISDFNFTIFCPLKGKLPVSNW